MTRDDATSASCLTVRAYRKEAAVTSSDVIISEFSDCRVVGQRGGLVATAEQSAIAVPDRGA